MPDHNPATHCALAARQQPVQLFGTAPHVDIWFLLEYPQPWGSKATTDNDLPAPIQEALQAQIASISHTRLTFIKQEERPTLDDLTLYIALASEQQPVLYKIKLPSISDLLGLDFAAFTQRDPAVDHYLTDKPLFLVCTNTRRDSCCARGIPIYEQLRQHDGIDVWQTTHIGGHRYAATLVALPHGVYYGHVENEDVTSIVTTQQQGAIHLPKTRGRTCYEAPVQAAAYFLREQLNLTALEALHLQTVTSTGTDEWTVTFQTGDTAHRLTIKQVLAAYQLPKSCGKDPAPVYEFKLLDATNAPQQS